MHIDVLVAEIGSTTTLINGFNGIETGEPVFVGQGQADTTVLDGDVRIGLENAVKDLGLKLAGVPITYDEMYATSSAAGGLRMCVHGLVYDMTVRAAQAAALGAGAIVKLATAGRLRAEDIGALREVRPNLILLAGGTDYGERDTALYNAEAIAAAGLECPVIYGGNIQNQKAVAALFEQAQTPCYVTENVYPRLDQLNIEPARRIIHKVFEEHITKAPGMERIRDTVRGAILPTPGAVMEAAQLLYDDMGDLAVLDIGGATTDLHSVTAGSDEIAAMSTAPEPFAKRTVEGDLGLYVNARNLVEMVGARRLSGELGLDVDAVMNAYKPIPDAPEQFSLTQRLCLEAGLIAVKRHAGRLRYLFTPSGRRTIAEGKDLSRIACLVATGGALTRLPERKLIMRSLADCNRDSMMLYPRPGECRVLFDDDYIMASLGVLSRAHPRAALTLLKRSLGLSSH